MCIGPQSIKYIDYITSDDFTIESTCFTIMIRRLKEHLGGNSDINFHVPLEYELSLWH